MRKEESMINLKEKKNEMKKIFILFIFVTLTYSNVSFAADCSDYSVFSHKWNMCKMGKLKTPSIKKSETETTTETSSETSSEEQTLSSKTKSKTSGVVKRLKSKTLWSMITGKESGEEEDKPKRKSLWSKITGKESGKESGEKDKPKRKSLWSMITGDKD